MIELNNDQDDFEFHSPSLINSSSSEAIFQAYLEAKHALSSVPKASRGIDYKRSMHTLLSEKIRDQSNSSALFRKNLAANGLFSQIWLARVSEASRFMEAWRRPPKFTSIDNEFLRDFAKLSSEPENIKTVEERLAEFGIIVIHERAIPGMKVDGACFLLPSGRPVVGLSLRYQRLDIYWFVLMHELAHISLHYELLSEPILDDFDEDAKNDIELEANNVAANSLIPRNLWRSSNIHYSTSLKDVKLLARKAETHPAIVAGRFRRENRKHFLFSEIINAVNTREIIFGHE